MKILKGTKILQSRLYLLDIKGDILLDNNDQPIEIKNINVFPELPKTNE